MNRTTFRFVIATAFLLPLMFVANVNSQQSSELVADIPFNFTVCQDQMPAGKYKVFPIIGANPRILLIRGEDNRSVEIICTLSNVQSSKPAAKGKLIFNSYGNKYFLSELWFDGASTGNQLVKTDEEQALVKELTAAKKREKVTVTATEAKPN
jgi:hypothetical protein